MHLLPCVRCLIAVVLASPARMSDAQERPAGRGSLAGVVRDTSAQPIAMVLVSVAADTNRTGLTDSAGRYQIDQLPPGIHKVTFRRIGFVPAEFQLLVMAGEARRAVVELVASPVRLDTVTVAGSITNYPALQQTGFFDRWRMRQEGAGVGIFVTPEEVDRVRSLTKTTHILETAGVRLIQSERGMSLWPVGTSNIILRPYPLLIGPCQMTVFIDGVEVYLGNYWGPLELGTGGLDVYIQPNEIRAIEIYRSASGTPLQFQSVRNAQCGSIVIWTKSG